MVGVFGKNSGETFDLIFTSHVLEHIVDPMKFIRECATICNRYMFVEVPCFNIKFVEEPYGMFGEEHVNFFTIQSLWHLMNNAGFAPIEFEMIFDLKNFVPAGSPAISTLWEKSSAKKLIYKSGACLERYLAENENLLQAVDEKIKQIPSDKKLALWGIAHHAAMLLANTSLAKKNIVRIYDSDKRKTGLKFFGVPIVPFNEADVISGEVDAILLTTYTAQRKISKVIDKMNLPCKIYKLYDI